MQVFKIIFTYLMGIQFIHTWFASQITCRQMLNMNRHLTDAKQNTLNIS